MNRLTLMMATALVAISPVAAPAPAHAEGDDQTAIVRFPGGYIAEIHAPVKP